MRLFAQLRVEINRRRNEQNEVVEMKNEIELNIRKSSCTFLTVIFYEINSWVELQKGNMTYSGASIFESVNHSTI